MEEIERWEGEFLSESQNYKIVRDIINPDLAEKNPADTTYRIHSKFYRTLSGKPNGGSLFKTITFICPGDKGPNKALQPSGAYSAVFNRHSWDSPNVYHRNLTGRVDRFYFFTKPIAQIARDHPSSVFLIRITGSSTSFKKPEANSAIVIGTNVLKYRLSLNHLDPDTAVLSGMTVCTFTIKLSAMTTCTTISPNAAGEDSALAEWTHIQLEQPIDNPPGVIGLEVIVRKDPFLFPVDQSWPPHRSDVTNSPNDSDIK